MFKIQVLLADAIRYISYLRPLTLDFSDQADLSKLEAR